jgi:hypothetical protein
MAAELDPIQEEFHRGRERIREPSIFVHNHKKWLLARKYQKDAFIKYKEIESKNIYCKTYNYDKDDIKFSVGRLDNQAYAGIYMFKEDGSKIPIADFNDVKVFLLDKDPVQWHDARNYQAWAYYHFIYSNENKVYYQSEGSEMKDHVTIELELQPNIVFSLSRNDNGSIFYEKNDVNRTRVRICNNVMARQGYHAFYKRMMSPLGEIFPMPKKKLVLKEIETVKTQDEEIMCVVCNNNMQNIRFMPCGHTGTCSDCCSELINQLCPLCRAPIQDIILYFVEKKE